MLDGCPHSGPSLAKLGDRLGLAWYTGAGSRSSLRFSSTSDVGATWSAPAEIQGPLHDANHPYLVAFEGDFWAIFQARENWEPVRAWVSKIGGAPLPLPTRGGGVSYPRLAAGTAGRLYAIWTEGAQVVLCRARLK